MNRRSFVAAGASLVGLGFTARRVPQLFDNPRTIEDVAWHLQRPIMAYEVWDGVPYAVTEFAGKVRFDRLILDPISHDWPPVPRWQLSGSWSSVDPSHAPASVAMGHAEDHPVAFGQINSAAIVQLQVVTGRDTFTFPVSGSGYAVRLPVPYRTVTAFRFLDAGGREVWRLPRPSR